MPLFSQCRAVLLVGLLLFTFPLSNAFAFTLTRGNPVFLAANFSLAAGVPASFEIRPQEFQAASFNESVPSAPIPVSFSFSQNLSYPVSRNASPLYGVSLSLANRINDGCYDSAGRDKCALAGFSGPGYASWCSECPYGLPACGNAYLHDWCYRFLEIPSANVSNLEPNGALVVSILASAGNFSCELSPPSPSCAENLSRLSILDFTPAPLPAPPNPFFLSNNSSFALLSPQAMEDYQTALADFRRGLPNNLPAADAVAARVNSVLGALLASASGNYSSYALPSNDSLFSANVSLNLSLSPPGLVFLHGVSGPLSIAGPEWDGARLQYALSIGNAGFVGDAFNFSINCGNDSYAGSLFVPATASAQAPFSFQGNLERACNASAFPDGAPGLFNSVPLVLPAFTIPAPSPLPAPVTHSSGGSSSSPYSPPPALSASTSIPSPTPAPSPLPLSSLKPPQFVPVPFPSILMPEESGAGLQVVSVLDGGQPANGILRAVSPSQQELLLPLASGKVEMNFSEPGYWLLEFNGVHRLVLIRPSLSSRQRQPAPPMFSLSSLFVFGAAANIPPLPALPWPSLLLLAVPSLLLAFFLFRPRPPLSLEKRAGGASTLLRVVARRPCRQLELEDFTQTPGPPSQPPALEEETVFGIRRIWRRESLIGVWEIRVPAAPSSTAPQAKLSAVVGGRRVHLKSGAREADPLRFLSS